MLLMTHPHLIVFASQNVVLPDYDVPVLATIVVDPDTGKITDIALGKLGKDDARFSSIGGPIGWNDVGDKFILPGLVDAHVHLNEPGRTDWEGFATGTKAAASGGVCTVVDMPLNSIPPTTTVENLELKRRAAQGQCWTDVAFWGGVIPGNQAELKPLIEAGVKGFKCFLIESGVEEFPCVSEGDVGEATRELEGQPTALLFHAELDRSPLQPPEGVSQHACTLYSTFLSSRPPQLESDAIALILSLQRASPSLRCHIVHLSAASALPLIRAAKAAGLPLTVETCFHYLCLAAERIPDGRPDFKCCPPIRDEANRALLWDALRAGVIDCVVSDHSPCVARLKRMDEGDVVGAWGGISTLGLGLSLLWTEGRARGVSVRQIVDWTCVNTAKHASLGESKGQIKVGLDADLIVWDPEAEFEVTKEMLNFKNKISPYEGLKLRGRVEKTFLRGRLVYDGEAGFVGLAPMGKLL